VKLGRDTLEKALLANEGAKVATILIIKLRIVLDLTVLISTMLMNWERTA